MRRQSVTGPGSEARSEFPRQQLRGYALILGSFVLLLAIALAASWGAISVVDSTRAYVTGESRYSKAEKIAVLSLHRYAYSGRAEDYESFLAATGVPRGDHIARVTLEGPGAHFDDAARGFLQGENNAADVAGMIRLFRWFSWWKPFADAVADWRNGDALVGALIAEGGALHAKIASHSLDIGSRTSALARIDRIDDGLTVLENQFSAHLGVAARGATMLVVIGLSSMTIVLWALGTGFATRLLRRQLQLGRELSSSERRFRDYAEVASDWYWEMDAGNRLTYLSERFADVVENPQIDVLGRDGADFIATNAVSAEQRQTYLAALAAKAAFRSVHVEVRRPDGTSRYWSLSGKPHTDSSGAFGGYRGVGSDITTAVRDSQTLRDAKIRAEVANRAKSEFLANMSHELRTPLNAILGFSDIIKEKLLGPDEMDRYSNYAADIHKSGAHLLAIIDDILDLSKIEAGHAELDERNVGLDDIARTLLTILDVRFAAAGIELQLDVPRPAPVVRVDERKFAQIFINLLSNALKFTPRDGCVTFSARLQSDGSLTIAVSDTGIGIAPEDIDLVMAPFGQIESAFSRKHHGTGLGLPLARSLAELHGGTLELRSVPGQGTTVTVTLPPGRVSAAQQSRVPATTG